MTTHSGGDAKASPRAWIGLAVLALPCLVYAMDLTILHLAVPAIGEELQPSSSEMLWIVDIYGFMVAGALITMGSLGDRYGRRLMLMIGAGAFAATSVLAALSTSPEQLIAARALQGLAGASLGPSTLSLIRNMFHDERERAMAIGIWIASFSAGAVAGPIFGGVILSSFHWSAVFLVNVPVMVLVIGLAPLLLPEFRDPGPERIDVVSVFQSLAAALLFVYGVKRAAEAGLSLTAVLAMMTGVAIGFAFFSRQRRLQDPLIDLKLFQSPLFGAALTFNLLDVIVVAGAFLLIAQHFQLVLGLGPLDAGLYTAPAGATFALGSLAGSWLGGRFSARSIIASGFLIAAAGFALLAACDQTSTPTALMLAMVVFSAGLAPIGAITTEIVLTTAPPERAGAASAVSEMSFELGGAFGIAILGSLVTAFYRKGLEHANAELGLSGEALHRAQDTLAGAHALAVTIKGEQGERLLALARESFVAGFQAAAWVSCIIVLAAGVGALTLMRR